MATAQSDLMVDLLKKIERNTAKGAQAGTKNKSSQSDVANRAAASLDADAEASTDALKNQTAAMEDHGKAVNIAAENVKEFLTYGEKIKNFAESGEKSFLGLNKSTLAYGKVLDDVFGGKLQKYGKKLFKFTGGIRKSFSAFKNLGKDIGAINKGLVGTTSKFARFSAFAKFGATRVAAVLGPIGIAIAAIGGTMVKVFMQTMKVGAKLTKFFIALPLTMAASAAKIGNSIRRDIVETIGNAAQETKELFDMSDRLGGKIGQATKGLVQFAQSTTTLLKFKNVTNDFVKLFGSGAGGVTALIKEYTSVLTNAGVFADIFAENVAKISKEDTPDNLILLTKATRALGMSTQDFSYAALESVKNGESLFKTLDDIAESTSTVSKEFGLNVKLIRKNFFVLRNDIINFGHLTNEELSETVAKVTQMGVSVKEASAMFNKFGTFEDAANSAALLSQTFGMNVDALQLIRAEKPEEIIEMFSDAMFATGRSFDELNRHEKAVMAQYTGLSAEALKSVMNYKNMGMTYSEIQKKMAEDDPTVQQRKNIEAMTGSLKEMQKVITDTSFIESFKRGLTATITLASGLDPVFTRISERMQEFYISGLKMPAPVRNKIKNLFSPITDAFEQLVGKEGESQGIFEPKLLSKATESFVDKFGVFLTRAFKVKKGDSIYKIQNEFSSTLFSAFDPKSLLEGDSIATQLMGVSGELIGKFLRGFAAIGPGMIKFVGKGFRDLVSFMTEYGEGEIDKDNSIVGMFRDFFKLSDQDIEGIRRTFLTLFEELKKSSGPFTSFFLWVNSKIIGLAADIVSEIGSAINKKLNPLYGQFTTDETLQSRGVRDAERRGYGASSLEGVLKTLGDSTRDMTDVRQMETQGQVQFIYNKMLREMESKIKREKNPAMKGRYLRQLREITTNVGEDNESLIKVLRRDDDDAVPLIRNQMMKFNQLYEGIMNAEPAKDFISDLLNGGKALIQGVGSGFNVTSFAPADQIMAGMSDGPIDAAIRYSGDMAAEVYGLIAGMVSPAASGNTQGAGQVKHVDKIELSVNLDGEMIAKQCVKANIVAFAKDRNLGGSYDTLGDGTTRNSSFGSTEGASY